LIAGSIRMRSARRFAVGLVASLVALYVVAMLGAHFLYRSILYPTPHGRTAMPKGMGELRTTTAKDGVPVHAWELAAPSSASIIVLFHGNGETMADNADLAADLAALGFGVLLVEYRGYGLSSVGSPTEQGLYLDAEAALDLLTIEGVPRERIILFGISLGTGVAAEMARRQRGAALVLMSPYTSIPERAAEMIPGLPMRYLLSDRFDTLSKAREILIPTLVIHGDEDGVIPFEMGRRVSSAISGARLVVIAGGHHNDLLLLDERRILAEVSTLAASRR